MGVYITMTLLDLLGSALLGFSHEPFRFFAAALAHPLSPFRQHINSWKNAAPFGTRGLLGKIAQLGCAQL